MNRFIDLVAALSLFVTTGVPSTLIVSAFGGWVSGGGELVRDTQNPWFIQNTASVSYCIEVDPNHFKAPRDRIEAVVKTAFDTHTQSRRLPNALRSCRQKYSI